jgi:hypothetical protein
MVPPSVFLSHAHADNRFAHRLAAALSRRDICVWVDEYELRIGDSVIERISQAIAEGDFLLAIISPASHRSRWCQQELAWAATRGVQDKRIVVLPIRYRNAEMPPALVDRRWADADKADVASLADRIAHDINRHLGLESSDVDKAWLHSALMTYEVESPETRERWRFHLKAAERAGRTSVRVDGSAHYVAADRLTRLGALKTVRTTRSWVFYEMTQQGRALLAHLRVTESTTELQ